MAVTFSRILRSLNLDRSQRRGRWLVLAAMRCFPVYRRFQLSLLLCIVCSLTAGSVVHSHDQDIEIEPDVETTPRQAACLDGRSGEYPCLNIDLVQFVPLNTFALPPNDKFKSVRTNDIWGWTDPLTGFEYAILGLGTGTAFIRIDEDGMPHFLGILRSGSFRSIWRDMKVYANHVFVVSEATRHGMQVFDLTRLRDLHPNDDPVEFDSDVLYRKFHKAHNIAIDEEAGYAYAVGTDTCAGGLHMIDIRAPKRPEFVGCFSADGYTHDAQCVVYHGPDLDYVGREICFNSNEDTLTVVDVTNKDAPFLISRESYVGQGYTHQGWLTEDHAYFLLGDEFDEILSRANTRTLVWDTSDLDELHLTGTHTSDSSAIDHNLYVRDNHVFQANYRSGIRILRLGDLSQAEMTEVAFFDTTPKDDHADFQGTWSVYPFFESGFIVASDISRGLYVLRPDLAAIPECSDGIDNDGDDFRDYPEDPTCIEDQAASEDFRFDVELAITPSFGARRRLSSHRRQLRLAILGSETVDVLDLDLGSLLFHPGEVVARARTKRGATRTHDVNRDGWPDIVLRILSKQSALSFEGNNVCITGLLSGDAFQSCVELKHRRHHRTGIGKKRRLNSLP
jgi:choice-of-anchor B domain-containing protein